MQVWVALEQETISGLSGPRSKRLFAPSLIDLGGNQEFGPCARQSGSQHLSASHCRRFQVYESGFRILHFAIRDSVWLRTPLSLSPDPPTLAFLKKCKGNRPKKARKIGKGKKQGNPKKARIGGSGSIYYHLILNCAGWFGGGMVRVVQVFGSGGSSSPYEPVWNRGCLIHQRRLTCPKDPAALKIAFRPICCLLFLKCAY